MTHPNVLDHTRSCAKWRGGRLLVATLLLLVTVGALAPGNDALRGVGAARIAVRSLSLGGSLAPTGAALARAGANGYGRPKSSRDAPIQGAKSDEDPSLVPGSVTDLRVSMASDTAMTLTWTEVNSSTSAIAKYVIRVDVAESYSWGSSTDVKAGGCGAPVYGSTAAGGRVRSCVLGGLIANRAYRVQLVAFTGVQNTNAVYGPLSNVVQERTAERLGPMVVSYPRFPIDTAFVDGIAISNYPGIYKGRYPIRGSFWLGSYTIVGYTGDSVTALGYLLVTKP